MMHTILQPMTYSARRIIFETQISEVGVEFVRTETAKIYFRDKFDQIIKFMYILSTSLYNQQNIYAALSNFNFHFGLQL